MKYEVPHSVTKALLEGLLSEGEKTKQGSHADAMFENFGLTIKEHVAGMSDDLRARLVLQAEICRNFMIVCRAFDCAYTDDETAVIDANLIEIKRLRKKSREVSEFMHFPLAAEQLSNAESFDEFCALLPCVDLCKTYGSSNGKTSAFPLIWAMSARDRPLQRVQLMLAANASVDLTKYRQTVLHEMAAMKRKAAIRLPILRLLVFRGADLEAENLHGQTPLTIAIESGSVENVAHFLAAGAKVQPVSVKRAMHDPQKLKLILDHLSDDAARLSEIATLGGWLRGEIKDWERNAKDALRSGAKGKFHALVLAKLRQSLAILAKLPGFPTGESQRKLTWQEEPAAFFAVRDAETLDDYRRALSQVDIKTFHMNGDHPIYWPIVAKNDRPERLWAMLAAGASVQGCANGTALHIFAENRRKSATEQFRIAQMLVQTGSDLEALNYRGLTPLACAIQGGGEVEAAALMQLGASPIVTLSAWLLFGDRYSAPIIFAAADNVRIFKAMLEMGVNPTACDDQGTCLRSFIEQEISRLTRMREGEKNVSGNLQKRIDRSIENFAKSLKLLI
jgi:ankyrin repeat protein